MLHCIADILKNYIALIKNPTGVHCFSTRAHVVKYTNSLLGVYYSENLFNV